MTTEQVQELIGIAGSLTQLVGCVMLFALFGLLQRRARRTYFGLWTAAWGAMTIAMASGVVRRFVRQSELLPSAWGATAPTPVLPAMYQLFKLAAIFLFVLGTLQYVRGRIPPAALRTWLPMLALYAVTSLLVVNAPRELIVWQTPVTGTLLGFAGVCMLVGLPPARRTLGTGAAGVMFSLNALLWLVYLPAFGQATGTLALLPASDWLDMLVRYNSFADFLLQMFLGFGMVVVLMEDAKREADDANERLGLTLREMRSLAHTDSLTGCLNRQGYLEMTAREDLRSAHGTVVVVDLDNLKVVNDRYGHSAGDELLRHAARVLRSAVPASASVFRWGGDEFILVLPGTRAAQAQPMLEAAILEAPPVLLAAEDAHCMLEASVGAAEYASAAELDTVIRHADRVMYAQKQRRKRASGSYAITAAS